VSRCLKLVLVIAVAAVCLLPAGASASTSSIPQTYCHGFYFQGELWGVEGTGAKCGFQRYWAYHYLRFGTHPRGWYCVGRGGDGGDCYKRHQHSHFFEFYAQD
jgi:hypothetical protein